MGWTRAWLWLWGVGLVACGAEPSSPPVGPSSSNWYAGLDEGEAAPLCDTCGACSEAFVLREPVHETEPIDYQDKPPAGGPHNGCWAPWGIHAQPVEDDRWVHNLEHGGVVFLYRCPEGCADEVAALEALSESLERTLLTPYEALPGRFAAVAWGRRLVSDCLDEQAFRAFHAAYFGRAPEDVAAAPPGGCH